jgi:hypothetical protein
MKLSSELIFCLSRVSWFNHCGRPIQSGVLNKFRQLTSWRQADLECTSTRWRDITENAQGELTVYLSTNYPEKYQGIWNRLLREAKPAVEQYAAARALEIAAENRVSKEFVDAVRWDVLCGIMEMSYKSCNPPVFFAQLLDVYKLGHFPCGIDEDGAVVLY